jgi:predicted RNase H-like HicB family nuclease
MDIPILIQKTVGAKKQYGVTVPDIPGSRLARPSTRR